MFVKRGVLLTKNKTFWLTAYKETVEDRKQGPDFKLIEFLDILPRGPVLDLGMGRGRHALFFAKIGRKIDGVDTSSISKGLPEVIESEGLDFTYHRMDIRDFEIEEGRYSLIIASKVLQLFRKSDIETLAKSIQAGLKPTGVVYISTFSVEDLEYLQSWDEIEEVERNTFYHIDRDQHFHFFSKEEILDLFSELNLQYYSEGLNFDRSPRLSRL